MEEQNEKRITSHSVELGDTFAITSVDAARRLVLKCPDGTDITIDLPPGGKIEMVVGNNPPVVAIEDYPGSQEIRVIDD